MHTRFVVLSDSKEYILSLTDALNAMLYWYYDYKDDPVTSLVLRTT